MNIQQYVMAYGVEQDRLRAILPKGFSSLRPVLRINAEVCEKGAYLEFNTPVEKEGIRGWLNIAHWDNAEVTKQESTVTFQTEELNICFTPVGVRGGCPAEKDNAGCWFAGEFRPAEVISANKEFCDCSFQWKAGAGGKSIGKTLPAVFTAPLRVYPKEALTVSNAAAIPCIQVLGSYTVCFDRI